MATLIDLPAELLSRIASYLFCLAPASHDAYEDRGFCSLRLSCRNTEAKTRYLFDSAAFSTVVVTLHAKSLRRLYDIASQDRFGRLLKKLVFKKARHQVFDQVVGTSGSARQHEYASYGVIELPREGDDGVYPNSGLSLKKRVRFGLQDTFAKVVALTPNLRELVIERNFMASFWLDLPSRQDQLNEAAQRMYQSTTEESQNVRARHLQGDVGFNPDSDSGGDSLHGENEDYDDDDYEPAYHIEAYVYPDYLLYLISMAAHQQGIRISSLSSNNAEAASIRARTFLELGPALQSLHHLEISMSVGSVTKLHRRDGSALQDIGGRPAAQSFSHALSRLTGLESLTLAFDEHYWEDDRLPMIAKSLNAISQRPFERLTKIDIEHACFEGKTLCHFLYNQRSILQALDLHYILLPTVEHWRPILAVLLGESPALLDLGLTNLLARADSETLMSTEEFKKWRNGSWTLSSGREKISAELQRLLGYFSGTSY